MFGKDENDFNVKKQKNYVHGKRKQMLKGIEIICDKLEPIVLHSDKS